MSNLYCKTKAGKIFKVWSDNTEEETLHVYPADEQFDAESTITTVLDYSEVEQVDSNLAFLSSGNASALDESPHKVAVACTNGNGEADLVVVSVDVSEDDIALGVHYDLAEAQMEEQGYDGPYIYFDEHEQRNIHRILDDLVSPK